MPEAMTLASLLRLLLVAQMLQSYGQCFKLEKRVGCRLTHTPHYNLFIVKVFIAGGPQ